jgi:putative intracellular protease/amidase
MASHSVLNKPGETEGAPTGVFGSEMTIPYYEFLDAGMQVDLASIKGGEIPVDPSSFYYFIKDKADRRYLKDKDFQEKVKNSMPVAEVDFSKYDVVFFAGGWGAAYDLGQSEVLAEKVSEAYYSGKPIFGSVCHGALAFIQAKDTTGNLLIKDRPMTGVTQDQLRDFRIKFTPLHPEEELKKAGADYKANRNSLSDIFATITVVDEEKRFITEQNQNSGHETAQKIMEILDKQ